MKTLKNLVVADALYVGGRVAQVDDQIQLFLDTENISAFPEFIYGVIVAVNKINCGSSTTYEVEYDEADLDGAVTALRPDDVVDYVVTDALAVEVAARIAGDAVVQNNVNAETAARIAADATKGSLINSNNWIGFNSFQNIEISDTISYVGSTFTYSPTAATAHRAALGVPSLSGANTFTYTGATVFMGSINTQNNLNVTNDGNIGANLNVTGYVSANGLISSGPISFFPLATSIPTTNGQLNFEATSNTQVKIKLKGSDGVVRSVTLTLA